ncbi:MAG TPA: hypothetical protein DE176_00420 [Clostridiales bacterium]|jgi:carbohydrate diacid regulator|nr:hypothetical protein [Clostridiales bacterium]
MMTLTAKIVQPFIATLEEALHYKVTITDTNGYIVGSSDPARLNQFHPSAYEILCERQPIESWDIATDSYVNVPEGVQLGYGERVIYDGECIGLIGLVGAPEEIKQSIKTAQLVLQLMLDRKKASDELKLISKDKKAFLLRLLQGQYGSPEWIKERADTYKIDLSRPRYVLTVQINLEKFDEKSPLELSQIKETMHRAIRSIFFEQEDLLYEYDTGETVLLTAGKHSDASQRRRQIEKAAARLYAELREQCKVSALIGVSEECGDYTGIPLALRQGRMAAEIGAKTENGEGLYFYSQMRLGRIVASFSPEIRPILQRDILSKLLENHADSLLETLFTYFEMNGNVSQTAEKLFIHRNTLQYRFRKIKEITGFDIYHIDDLVQLRLAVLQYRYFGI